MKKFLFFSLLFGLALLLVLPVSAQSRRQGERRTTAKDSPFKDKLWYGGFFGLGFGSDGFTSSFSINVSPMVGYKILPPLSIGPRVGVGYNYFRIRGVRNFNLFDFEIAAFARLRVYRGFFLHGEIGSLTDQYVETNGVDFNRRARTRPAQYAGIGYNFSGGRGGFGQEISILYDFYIGSDINSFENPWQYRFAFTYGF